MKTLSGKTEIKRFKPTTTSYWSCQDLERGSLHFSYQESLKACCRRDFVDMPELLKYTDEPIDVHEAVQKIQDIRQSNNSEDRGICDGCPHLVQKAWDEPPTDYLINHSIILNHYTLCNQRCTYCDIWSNIKPLSISQNLKFLFEGKYVNPNALIILGGGEPALLKGQLADIIDLSRGNGNPIAISSNASVYSPILENFLKTEIRPISRITTSLDAGTRELYMSIHGKDDFDKVVANLKKYHQAKQPNGARMIVKYIVDETNCEEEQYMAFVNLVVESGFDDIMLNLEREHIKNEDDHRMRRIRQDIASALHAGAPGISVELAG